MLPDLCQTFKMADRKTGTTNTGGLFGQPLSGDLNLLSGPRLFTPVPQNIQLGPQGTPPATLNRTFPSVNTPLRPPTTRNAPFSTPPPMFNVPPPMAFSSRLPSSASPNNATLPTSIKPPMNIPPRQPAPSIPTMNVSVMNQQSLTGPMIPKSSSSTPVPLIRPMQVVPPQPVTPMKVSGLIPPSQLHYNTTPQAGTAPQPSIVPQQQQQQQQQFSHTIQQQEKVEASSNRQIVPTDLNTNEHKAPEEFNISPFATGQNTKNQNDFSQPLSKVVPHWFYLKSSVQFIPFHKVSLEWKPFSILDSRSLEHEYLMHKSAQFNIVHTDGGRYDVDLNQKKRTAVYWNEPSTEIRRCTWFVKEENQFVPYEQPSAEKLEESYLAMLSKGVSNIRVDLSEGVFVLFHNPSVLVQYSNSQDMEWTGEDVKARPKVVRRGLSEEMKEEIEEGEESAIEHVVFVVHGIGPVADLRMRSIIECVDDLRKNTLHFTKTNGYTVNGRAANRVEFFPIQWYGSLRDEKLGIDKQLNSLSLSSISKLRNFTNEVLTDILFFTSPMYCQKICDTVVDEMNRIYKLFIQRNPKYTGSTSVVGHSLGTCISFDIIANQDDNTEYQQIVNPHASSSSTPSPRSTTSDPCCQSIHELLTKLNLLTLQKQFHDEQIDLDSLMMCQESDLKDLGIAFGPRKKLLSYISDIKTNKESSPRSTSTQGIAGGTQSSSCGSEDSAAFSYQKASVGTGQPLVKYKKLNFKTESLFCLGSPLGLFLTCRGVTKIGPEYRLPKCPKFINIFHPYDPVVYRLEPLINELINIPPVLIPHHKGRKRFHLEIKENLSRVGANLKSGIMSAFSKTWSSINDFARLHQSDYQPNTEQENQEKEEITEEISISEQEALAQKRKEESLDFGQLNGGQRIDYVLQERPFEVLNEYLFALGSHTCYWTSEDTALLILKQIYNVKD